ncbi:hypothetical protein, partial [Erwinia amylovora]
IKTLKLLKINLKVFNAFKMIFSVVLVFFRTGSDSTVCKKHHQRKGLTQNGRHVMIVTDEWIRMSQYATEIMSSFASVPDCPLRLHQQVNFELTC